MKIKSFSLFAGLGLLGNYLSSPKGVVNKTLRGDIIDNEFNWGVSFALGFRIYSPLKRVGFELLIPDFSGNPTNDNHFLEVSIIKARLLIGL